MFIACEQILGKNKLDMNNKKNHEKGVNDTVFVDILLKKTQFHIFLQLKMLKKKLKTKRKYFVSVNFLVRPLKS